MAETEIRTKQSSPVVTPAGSATAVRVAGRGRGRGGKIRRLRWLIIGLVFLATLINYIDRLTVSVLAPVITEALKLSNLEYASLGTWFLLAYTISQGLSGRLYDRFGVRRGFTLSLTVWSLAAIAHAFARGLGSLSAFRFLLGLGEAGNWPGAVKVTAEWFPVRERAFAMAIFNSGAAIGSIVAPPMIVWLQLSYGWQTTFIITGGLGFFWLALWLFCYQPPDRHRWITEEERAMIQERESGRAGERESGRVGIEAMGRLEDGVEERKFPPLSPSPAPTLSPSPTIPLSPSPRWQDLLRFC